jgi:hypothetical protein
MANNVKPYNARDYGKTEENLKRLFDLQYDDAKTYFDAVIKPRLDRAYKLYVAYTGDRQKEIKKWQSNIFVPYVNAVVETMMPRLLDARPEFSVQGREESDQPKSIKQKQLMDYSWEMASMDKTAEDLARAALVYGTGFLQVSWKKDSRKLKFLKTKDVASGKYKWEEKEKVFYDAPYAEWVDNYSIVYDWHNIKRESKQFWIKRLVLTKAEIKRKYPMADKKRLEQAFAGGSGDLADWASIRAEVKSTHDKITKGSEQYHSQPGVSAHDRYVNTNDTEMQMYEVFEWIRPFDDQYAVMVGGQRVPILKGGSIPNPYDFKETPFIEVPYLRLPGEFEGIGLPLLLENPQIMLNLIKNQRLDATTLSIHKMWIVNPLANINKDELVTRPFGIIYSVDPAGVREVQFSDIKPSAYREEEMLKGDLRYASGVDDFSMGVGGSAGSATEIRHLRESTLERVRLFVNHLGDGFGTLMRYWIDMYRQFGSQKMIIRITGDDGQITFPLVEKDDLMGNFDYRASVIPSIAGQNDIEKKQGMDLFQLLISLPFVDQRKLTSKVLTPWGWSLDSVTKSEEEQPQMPGMGPEGMIGNSPVDELMNGSPQASEIPPDVLSGALSMIRGGAPQNGGFQEAGSPIDLLQSGAMPPTVPGIPAGNPRGMNRGGRVNTNIPMGNNSTPEGSIANRAINIQR